jgi:hypothetical protein
VVVAAVDAFEGGVVVAISATGGDVVVGAFVVDDLADAFATTGAVVVAAFAGEGFADDPDVDAVVVDESVADSNEFVTAASATTDGVVVPPEAGALSSD